MLLMSPRRVSNVLGSINQAVLYRLRELSSDASGGIAPPQVSGHRVHAGQKKSELGLWTPAHPIHRRGRGPEPSPTPIPHCFVTHAHWFPAEGRRNATRFLTGGSVAGGGAPVLKRYKPRAPIHSSKEVRKRRKRPDAPGGVRLRIPRTHAPTAVSARAVPEVSPRAEPAAALTCHEATRRGRRPADGAALRSWSP